ncbi:MAG: competence/damage-inducible protein A [Candidatus Obscuribacterales bacterium]|nr:competence/damage-inducible protein A [Candidatus Obscuribacterales bacterium]
MASAEILSIGTELLLGQILDTNSQFISIRLANLGIDCLYKSTVGDNVQRIIAAYKQALDRSDLVISTGGLGPTADDLTHECLSELFKAELVFDQASLERIESFFKKRGIKMVESNKKQAYRPAGADILFNPTGTAPGIIWSLSEDLLERAAISNPKKARYIMTFPGVPSEMKRMWTDSAEPFLAEKFGPSVVWSQELKHYGIGESNLAEKYAELLSGSNPTVAPLAGTGECRLRVSAKSSDIEAAKKIAAPVIERIRKESGTLCYGVDNDSLESVLAELLKKKGLTLSVAESCTGGLLSKRLTDIDGSSAYVKLNLVTYANEAKIEQLKVGPEIIEKHGAVSSECALAMALGVRALAKSDLALSITGIAGPSGGSDEKPVGLVYFGLSAAQSSHVIKRQFPEQLGRDGIRQRAASEALNFLRLYLLNPAGIETLK